MRASLKSDFERFREGLPADWPQVVREQYGIDLTASYLGVPLPHPIGKGSGQLSLKEEQLAADAEAGLAYTVLKTVIAEDEGGAQSMVAWAIHEARMLVEPRLSATGRAGWTVTWKGRGWDRSLEDYLALVRVGRDFTRAGSLLVVPSVKFHLPRLEEPFREEEYQWTTGQIAAAWGSEPLLLEKDFSPTLAGDLLGDEQERILRWIREVPGLVTAAHGSTRLALKLMNARFDDEFQLRMLEAAAASGAAGAVVFNRLFDPALGVAYGGWDLSDRNLRVLARPRARAVGLPLAGTGNINTGRMVLDYARHGCASVQLHTFFQLPLGEYAATAGSRTARALHQLVFHPQHGLVAGMLDLEGEGLIHRRDGVLRFLDLAEAHED